MDRDEKLDVGTGATADRSAQRTPPVQPLDANEEKAASRAAPPVGALGGVAGGAAVGTVIGGPAGTLVGAIAGALGGWWIGSAASNDIPYSEADDEYFRAHYETDEGRLADRGYSDVRPLYQLGHVARNNPDYRGRDFEAIEGDLRRGWTDDARRRYGEWDAVKQWVRAGYTRDDQPSRQASHGAIAQPGDIAGSAPTTEEHDAAVEGAIGGSGSWNADFAGRPRGYIDPAAGADLGGTESHHRASFSDPAPGFPDREVGSSGAALEGHQHTSSSSQPDWMETPTDQGGFGERIRGGTNADDARPASDAPERDPRADDRR
jgi:hypothetical protein